MKGVRVIKKGHEAKQLYEQLTNIWDKVVLEKSKVEIDDKRTKITLIFERYD